MHVWTKRRSPWKSTVGSEKTPVVPVYVIHRQSATVPMMEALNDTCKRCKETLILTIEVSERVSLECIHTRA